ncbi:MAG TPA: 4Fe-4S dicluster domain-containing protein, partial [Ramlibacter sp.]|nr:4Fe-4S dicluster domain-containing protein [Ramlibacter sp.]
MSEAAPPSASLVALADQCVQCGLCLPACPTYALERIEAESPRGRIALARHWALQLSPATPTGERHLDQCLGCRRCEAVCPAGVHYGPILVQARAEQRTRRRPSWRQQALEWLCARPSWLGSALQGYRMAYPLLPKAARPLPRPPARWRRPSAERNAAARSRVVLFTGCVADVYEARLRAACIRLCATVGIAVEMLPALC